MEFEVKLNLQKKSCFAITQGLFQPNRLQMMADKLLLQVMHGEQDKAEVILKRRPDLLMIKGTATDYSGRKFTCTAFQYALWALDTRYMCSMMLDCLPCSPDGERIKEGLLMQLFEQTSNGIEFQLDTRTVREKHYDFTPLLNALKTYVDNYDHWFAASNWAEMTRQWNEVVGLAQRYVPAHVAQHYCDPDETFYPTPNFNKPQFARVLHFYNYRSVVESHWFSPIISSNHGLGVDFGIARGARAASACNAGARCGLPLRRGVLWHSDFMAVTALSQIRTKDLEPLRERLQRPLQKAQAESGAHAHLVAQ
jgi:hypothetical protein